MTPIPPSLREKKRYLLERVLPEGFEPDRRSLHPAVHDAVTSLWGDVGMAEISAVVVKSGAFVVIRCRRGEEGRLITALATVNRVGDTRCALRPVAVSGTIAALCRRMKSPGESPEPGCITWSGRMYESYNRSGQKVDLIEKGFMTREQLFFTQNDVWELF